MPGIIARQIFNKVILYPKKYKALYKNKKTAPKGTVLKSLFICLKHLLKLVHEGVHILELSVYGCESDISYVIHILKLVHHKLTDDTAFDLLLFHAEDLGLHIVYDTGDLVGTDGTLVTCPQYTGFDLRSVVLLTILILLYNDKGNGLNLLVCGKTLAALVAYTTSSDGVILLGGS